MSERVKEREREERERSGKVFHIHNQVSHVLGVTVVGSEACLGPPNLIKH